MKLENERYSVKFDLVGAEITSFFDKQLQIEYIWSGDASYWSGRNPILFPVIGSSVDQKYYFDNEAYTMGNHGFLRRATFELVNQHDNQLTFGFKANSETLKQYPFKFQLQVTYQLMANQLLISYQIENQDYQVLPFNFGLHPAFNCPLLPGEKFSDYSLSFSNQNEVYSNLWPEKQVVHKLPLSYEQFEAHPTWLFTGSSAAEISYSNQKHGVNVSIVGFPVVAVWTPQAPFICLEPWFGLGQKTAAQLDFAERDATALVEPDHLRQIIYHITVF